MTPSLDLACGCTLAFSVKDAADLTVVTCQTHGQTRVTRTRRMPAPRFRGVALGPHVETAELAPFTGVIGNGAVWGGPQGGSHGR